MSKNSEDSKSKTAQVDGKVEKGTFKMLVEQAS
jgi:hypothetical protein